MALVIYKNEKKCIHCNAITNIDDFNISRGKVTNICIICYRIQRYNLTFNSFIRTIYHTCKKNSKTKLKKGRIVAGTFNITKQELINLYHKQNGLCYYSNIMMNTKPATEWKCSLERLDPNKGYIIDNVVFVCLEFNGKVQ